MKLVILSLMFIVFSYHANARNLTWKEATDLAQKNCAELQAAQETYNAALETEFGARSLFLPHLSANMRATKSGSPSTPTQFSYSASLNYTQNLFSGLSDYNNYQIKKANSAQALLELNTVKARLSQELKQTYAEVYYSQLNTKLSETILKRRQENFKSVQLQYEVGRENKGSLLLSQANVESAQYDFVRAQNDADTTLENFRRLLGLGTDESVVVIENIEKTNAPKELPNFSLLVSQNYAVLKATNEEAIANFNLQVAKSGFMPSLDFTADYGYADNKFFPENDNWSMGLSLTIPLFDGFKDYASYQSNRAKLKSSNQALVNIKLITLRDLKTAYYDYVEALQKEKVDTSFNQAAILRAEIARNKYKNGLLSFEDWDLIESDLILKQKEFISSEKNTIVKQSLWEKAQGIGVFK